MKYFEEYLRLYVIIKLIFESLNLHLEYHVELNG